MTALRDDLPTRVDVAVIGGGIAGASVAYEIAAEASVVLVEAEPELGRHSTGRSAAVLTTTTGPPVVRHLAAESRGFLEHPPTGFADVPLGSSRPVLWVAAAAEASALADAAVGWTVTSPSVRSIDTAEAMGLVPLLRPEGAATAVVEPEGLSIDVDALLQGYRRGLRRRGGHVLVSAPVQHIDRTAHGWRLRTPGATIDVASVVNAAGAWADRVANLAGIAGCGLVPMRRTAFVFAPPEGVDARDWPLVMDAAGRWYLEPEGLLLLGSPADEAPTTPGDARPEEVDVALGVQRLEGAFDLRIHRVLRAWAGLRTFSPDRAPVVGPDPAEPSFVWLAGQGGYGIKTAPALALLAAAAALGVSPPAGGALAALAPALAPERFVVMAG